MSVARSPCSHRPGSGPATCSPTSATGCRSPASASPSSVAARRGSWLRPMPRCASPRGAGETDAFAASQFPTGAFVRPGASRSRAPGTTTEVLRAISRSAAPVTAITAVHGAPVADRRAGPRSSSTSPTSSRSSRRVRHDDADAAPRVARRAVEPVVARRRSRILDGGDASRPGGRRGGAVQLPGPGMGRRDRERGRAEDARGGARVDRELSADGVPARPDLDRRAGPGGLGLRRAGARPARRHRGHRRDRRRRRPRPGRRPGPGPAAQRPARA